MELERVRSMMEEHPRLGRLLASRAGKTDLQDLQWLLGNGKDRDISPGSRVVLVDWVIIGDKIVMVTLDARLEPQMSVLDMALTHRAYHYSGNVVREPTRNYTRAGGLRTAFFSAYEDHIEDKVKITQREVAYKCIRKLASDFGSEPRLGCNANRENLTTVVKDVDVLHFHGHTATHPNIIYQSLVLSDGKTSETSSGVQEFHHTQSSTSPYRPTLGPHKDAFTVRDAFSLDLNLSLASIVACSSGVQNYGTGDEPQGLLSALQYAGCATAIGTLWPLHSEDGRAFTLYFFQAVRRQGDNIASPWNLALSFQKAVRRLQGRKKAGLRLDHPYHLAAFHGAWYL
ncbi:hypothetical protein BFJ71_g13505 [Fusarium oxysporum]|nr:hypothetical protein BFJ71_g13505 [Fusarium oxysporum]